jgi:hypothetical protein
MRTSSWGFIAVLMLSGGAASAQTAQAVLQAASRNMGADNLRCVSYTGTGYVGLVGQTFDMRSDWPRVELASYSRTINYDARTSREERVIRQGNYPAQGGGNMPIQGEQRQVQLVNDRFAWNIDGANATPAPAAAELRQLEIWLTPHGFLRGAMAPGANPVLITRYEGGALGGLTSIPQRKVNIISTPCSGNIASTGRSTRRISSSGSRRAFPIRCAAT